MDKLLNELLELSVLARECASRLDSLASELLERRERQRVGLPMDSDIDPAEYLLSEERRVSLTREEWLDE